VNGFERTGRAKKAAIIFALVPAAASNMEAFAMAGVMEGWTQAERNRFSQAAGVARPPSEETWALLCGKVRSQIADRDEEARMDASVGAVIQ
jgi:hypothetical protein